MKLRDALGTAPGSKAHNEEMAWGYGTQATATRLDDGRIHLSAYLGEREWFERDYADIDVAGRALYESQGADEDENGYPVDAYWHGPDEWESGKE